MTDSKRRKSFLPQPETPVSAALVDLNDDALETEQRKKQRRLANAGDTPSTVGSTATGVSVGRAKLAKMTVSERQDHAEKCLQLSAANKISAKNAFSLLLIDQMVELVRKEEASFQVASTHLDASAKIYACRVDKVHSDVLRFAGGLATNKRRDPVQDEDSDGDAEEGAGALGDGDEAGLTAVAKPKKKRGARNVTAKDAKSLNSKAQLHAVNISELFLQHQLTSAEASEPGNCHFMLTLPMSGGQPKLQLRGEEIAFPPVCPELPSVAGPSLRVPDLSKCLSMPLLPTEIHRMLVEGDAERELNQQQTAPPEAQANDYDDDGGNDDFANDEEPAGGGEDEWTEEAVARGAAPGGGAANLVNASAPISSSQTMHLLTPLDYQTLHRAALGLTHGPRFWKPLPSKPSSITRRAAPARRAAAPTELDYECHAGLFAPFVQGMRTELSAATINGWQRSPQLLPPNDPDVGKRFQQLWMRDRVPIMSLLEDGIGQLQMDDHHENNGSEVMDRDASFANFMGGGGDSDDGDDLNDAETECAMRDEECETATGLPPLNYAKRAKGIDMRALKKASWDLIRHGTSSTSGKENAEPSQEMAFSQLYKQLPAKLSSKMATNLSPALAFMSVLHLANEHNLALHNPPDLSDLYIRKMLQNPTQEPTQKPTQEH